MPDASDTTRRRQQRMLFASKVIAETTMQKGYTNHIILEGGVHNAAITNETYDKMRDGTVETTVAENTLYVSSVPNRQPDPPTINTVTAVNGEVKVYYSPPAYEGISSVVSYRLKSTDGTIDIAVTSNPAIVTGLASGSSYQFVLYAINTVGTSAASEPSDTSTVIGLPTAPTGLYISNSGITTINSVSYYYADVAFTLSSFDGGAPITAYTIVSTPGFTDISGSSHGTRLPPYPPTSSYIQMTGLTNGVTYTFSVVATNANGNSQQSASVSYTVPALPPTIPDTPTNVTAIRGNGQAIVSFVPPINNGGSAITSYTATVSPGGITVSGSTTPITITGLTNGTDYTVTVYATNTVGNSSVSAVSNTVRPAGPPAAPTGVTAAAGNAQAVVSFTAPANNGSGIISYTVTSSPGGFTATGGSSPITVLGLTNNTAVPPNPPNSSYTFTVVATNGVGTSSPSSASNTAIPQTGSLPGAPTNVSAIQSGDSSATVSFTAPSNVGTPPFTSFKITSNPATTAGTPQYVSNADSSVVFYGLTPGVNYTFNVVATNTFGDSDPGVSNQIIAGVPLAPVLTTSCIAVTQIILNFTQSVIQGSAAITNYKYSLNGLTGPFTSFSPVDAVSPVTITGLTATTTYNIVLKATNANGDSLPSNVLTLTTKTNTLYARFTTVGATTWTAPAGVTFVEYIVVGGGGGGGGCYSEVIVLGDVPFLSRAPFGGGYWIFNDPRYSTHGYMYEGNSPQRPNFPIPVRLSVLSILNNNPNVITPGRTSYGYNKWYAETFVYTINSGYPTVVNSRGLFTTAKCNTISAGSGGGAGGEVLFGIGTSCYLVTSGQTYTVVVGAGGAGGEAVGKDERVGKPGVDSQFATIIAKGGSGGGVSRQTVNNSDLNKYNNGGYGGTKYGGLYGGQGGQGSGQGAVVDPYALVTSGGPGGIGATLNLDGTPTAYGAGGNGGIPDTNGPTSITITNRGNGGSGTGALLNSANPGQPGDAGIVILKYYT
jgi:hypothetical protein